MLSKRIADLVMASTYRHEDQSARVDTLLPQFCAQQPSNGSSQAVPNNQNVFWTGTRLDQIVPPGACVLSDPIDRRLALAVRKSAIVDRKDVRIQARCKCGVEGDSKMQCSCPRVPMQEQNCGCVARGHPDLAAARAVWGRER
jgi:hypothetical protein